MNRIYLVNISILIGIISLSSCGQDTFVQGKRIYEVNCSNCHMADGMGLGEMYPAIKGSSYLTDLYTELPCIIKNGKQGAQLSNVIMPAHPQLTDVGINNLINYIQHEWGDGRLSNLNELQIQLDQCPDEAK